ncbi:peptidase U32 family protein [Aminipila sp.]|uniref:peptidase U32 family protein n=1 Tax=Aminipila sp. TaxID=2060095 RepID=UPI00289E6909|nr:U32 family peptidase [Aminipila sp.]
MPNIPELLAPAGGIQQLKAAVENGADAVYLGGKLFNARINAGNFDDETMKEALAYAHLRNVKIYVTMNILIKDDELEEALQYAKKLYEFGVDALIIQDLGFARMLRRRLPSMKIHLSTQGTVYNPSGVKMAKSLGFERVVLAREVTLDEIKEITKENLLEIEVFVHGALCICYSGQCQMSRVLGGRSGNRGMCAQPCRLEFIADDKKQGNHLLSPKDLCSVDFLGELAEAGIASLKIEGRMKSPEYVAIVTRIYRKYLDEYQRNGCYKVEKEDREKLTQIFNRGSFTSGYLKGDPEEELMSADIPKHQGVYIGKVTASAQRDLIDIQLEGKLSIGDGVEIRNKYMPGNVVTYLKPVKDKIVRIGDIKGKVWSNDPVYKITDKALMLEARESFEGQSSSQMQYYRKAEVTAFFQALLHKKPVLFINDGAITVRVEGETAVERAIKRSLTEEDIAKQLNKTGEVPFRILNICFEVEEGIALPMSVINQMRREAFNQLIHEKTKVRKLSPDETDLFYELTPNNAGEQKNGERKEKTEEEIQVELYFHTMEHVNKKTIDFVCKILTEEELSVENMRLYVPLYEYIENQNDKLLRFIQTIKEQYKIKMIPYLPNVTKGAYDSYIVINFDKIISICRDTGISIGNLGWISEFQKSGVQVYGDYGLNIYNREAVS